MIHAWTGYVCVETSTTATLWLQETGLGYHLRCAAMGCVPDYAARLSVVLARYSGTLDGIAVRPAEVFRSAMRINAARWW